MVTVDNIEVKSTGFRLIEEMDAIYLAMIEKPRVGLHPKINDPNFGGVRVEPEFIISDIPQGRIFLTQVCNDHQLNINFFDGTHEKFDSAGQCFKDGQASSSLYYHWLHIKDNLIKAPLLRLR